jgi:hypothetical protein
MASSALLHRTGVMMIENGQLTMVASGCMPSSPLATTIESPDDVLPYDDDEYRTPG